MTIFAAIQTARTERTNRSAWVKVVNMCIAEENAIRDRMGNSMNHDGKPPAFEHW